MLLCAEHILPITGEPLRDGAVLVRDNKIADIGSAELFKLKYPEDEVHDFGNAALMPGFVNLNAHAGSAVLRGIVHDVPYTTWLLSYYRKVNAMDDADWRESALLGALENVCGGITTVADIATSGEECKALAKAGLRGVVYREVGALDKQRVARNISLAEADIEEWGEAVAGSCLTVGVSPASPYRCHPSVYREVSRLARRKNLPVAMQLAAGYEEFDFLRQGAVPQAVFESGEGFHRTNDSLWMPTGTTPINYALNWDAFESDNILALHCVCVDDIDVAKLKEYDIAVAVCSRVNAQLAMGVAPIDEYLRAGLRLGLGTDSPAAVDSTDMMAEMRIGMLVQRSVHTKRFLDSGKMLEMATMGGARALRMEDKIGSLEVGKLADIIAIDLSGSHQTPMTDPVAAVVNSCGSNDVLMTMVNGTILYENNQWRDPEEVARNVAHVIAIRNRLRD